MDKLKKLNDEELEKVNGGTHGWAWMEGDKLEVYDEMDCTCDGEYYKGWVTGGIQMCRDCDYYKDGFCTNKDAWEYILKSYYGE